MSDELAAADFRLVLNWCQVGHYIRNDSKNSGLPPLFTSKNDSRSFCSHLSLWAMSGPHSIENRSIRIIHDPIPLPLDHLCSKRQVKFYDARILHDAVSEPPAPRGRSSRRDNRLGFD